MYWASTAVVKDLNICVSAWYFLGELKDLSHIHAKDQSSKELQHPKCKTPPTLI